MIIGLNYKKSVKEKIISILGSIWPLKIKQIQNHLKKEFNVHISYQAIHKSITELEKEQTIIRTEDGIQLSNDWINNSYNFFHKIKDSYRNNFSAKLINNEGNITTINLKNIIELDNFYFDLFDNIIKNSKKNSIVFCLKHNWRPILYSQKEHELLTQSQKKFYFIVYGNNNLDKWCSNFEKKSKAKSITGNNYSPSCDLYIIDDLIIQIYIVKEIMEKIEQLFTWSKRINDIDINNMIKNIFEKKTKIVILINKNEELASQMKNQVINMFDNKK